MKPFVFLALLAIALFGCEKDVAVEDVLSALTLTPRASEADGQSTVQAQVTLSEKTSSERRNVIFTTNKGVFTTSGKNKETVKAEFVNGILVARASLRVPIQPATLIISVQPEYDSPVRDYLLSDSIKLAPSMPASFTLESSRFGIGTNFSSEVRLVGSLSNLRGGYVSKNNTVQFEDLLLNGTPANGRFGKRSVQSNDTSRVSTFYAANSLPLGTTIKIKGTVLDATGRKTSLADSVLLTVNM